MKTMNMTNMKVTKKITAEVPFVKAVVARGKRT